MLVTNCFRLEQKSYLPFMSGFGKTTIFNGLIGNRPNVFCWASDYLIWSSFWTLLNKILVTFGDWATVHFRHWFIRRTKHWEVVVSPPFGQTMRTNSVLTTYFPYNITTIYIQKIFAITIPETRIVFIQSHRSRDSYSRHRNTARYQQQEQSENVPE